MKWYEILLFIFLGLIVSNITPKIRSYIYNYGKIKTYKYQKKQIKKESLINRFKEFFELKMWRKWW
jgi:hypothetical protein